MSVGTSAGVAVGGNIGEFTFLLDEQRCDVAPFGVGENKSEVINCSDANTDTEPHIRLSNNLDFLVTHLTFNQHPDQFFYIFLLQILRRELILQHKRCKPVDRTPEFDGKTIHPAEGQ